MQHKKGFIQIPALVAIVAATAILGAGAFVVVKNNTSSESGEANLASSGDDNGTEDEDNAGKEKNPTSTEDSPEDKNQKDKQPRNEVSDTVDSSDVNNVPQENDQEGEFAEARLLVGNFLSNPTLENFEEFCRKGQDVLSPKTERVLNEDRTDFIDKPVTVAHAVGHCEHILNEGNSEHIKFAKAGIHNLVPLTDNDSDFVRKQKIKYNNKIKDLNKHYKFYVYGSSGGFSTESNPLRETIEKTIQKQEQEKKEGNRLRTRSVNIDSPEQRVREFLRSYF